MMENKTLRNADDIGKISASILKKFIEIERKTGVRVEFNLRERFKEEIKKYGLEIGKSMINCNNTDECYELYEKINIPSELYEPVLIACIGNINGYEMIFHENIDWVYVDFDEYRPELEYEIIIYDPIKKNIIFREAIGRKKCKNEEECEPPEYVSRDNTKFSTIILC